MLSVVATITYSHPGCFEIESNEERNSIAVIPKSFAQTAMRLYRVSLPSTMRESVTISLYRPVMYEIPPNIVRLSKTAFRLEMEKLRAGYNSRSILRFNVSPNTRRTRWKKLGAIRRAMCPDNISLGRRQRCLNRQNVHLLSEHLLSEHLCSFKSRPCPMLMILMILSHVTLQNDSLSNVRVSSCILRSIWNSEVWACPRFHRRSSVVPEVDALWRSLKHMEWNGCARGAFLQ